MEYQQLINENGGKAASILAQYNAGNTDMIFPFTLVDPNEFEQGNIPIFKFVNPQIVRGSAKGDEKGLVNVIKTQTNVSPKNRSDNFINIFRQGNETNLQAKERLLIEDFKHPIQSIINNSRRREVINYAKWEGLTDYKGISKIIIQPQNVIDFKGSIIEHPNIKNHYLINFVEPEIAYDNISQYLVNQKGKIIVKRTISGRDSRKNVIKQIVAMKERSRKVGFIPKTHSSQVEFGFLLRSQNLKNKLYDFSTSPTNSIIFYQERSFLPFDFDSKLNPNNYKFNRFGKLEKETSLRTIKLGEVKDKGIFTDDVPSAYVFDYMNIAGSGTPLSFLPTNMVAFIVPPELATIGGYSLEHNTFRWAQKAKVSLLNRYIGEKFNHDCYKHKEMIKIK